MKIEIRKAEPGDYDSLWPIFQEVLKAGDTWPQLPTSTKEENFSVWFRESVTTYVATEGTEVVGAYLIRPNQPGLGSHIANAGYIVASSHRGKGIGELLGRHSLTAAKSLGYTALQFNLVVSTNKAGVALWQKIGFRMVGVLPGAFRHTNLGFVDAYVMFQEV